MTDLRLQEWRDLLSTLSEIEVKGVKNVFLMNSTFIFIQSKIKECEKDIQEK